MKYVGTDAHQVSYCASSAARTLQAGTKVWIRHGQAGGHLRLPAGGRSRSTPQVLHVPTDVLPRHTGPPVPSLPGAFHFHNVTNI